MRATTAALLALLVPAALGGCAADASPADPRPATAPVGGAVVDGAVVGGAVVDGAVDRSAVPTDSVLVVSVDGLTPAALRRLGPDGTPVLHRLLAEGAATLDARTSWERTETLPNHTGMLTGHRVDRRAGGHGVTANTDIPGTVHRYAGRHVPSVFEALGRAGRSAALFAMKTKFRLFQRSWPRSVDRFQLAGDSGRLVTSVRRDLRDTERGLRFVHLADPDVAGHHRGFMGAAYLEAVRRVDRQVGRLLEVVETTPALAGTTLVLTADHGGWGHRGHAQADRLVNYRVPFVAWGAGVAPGTDLYDLNPDRTEPGTRRPAWGTRGQPVRNAEVANLALDLLGLPALRGSIADAAQDLDLR